MIAPYLIAGLGNPGSEYARTRHNAGFLVVEELARLWGAEWREDRRFEAQVAEVRRSGRRIWLVRPMTYMNASGEAIGGLAGYYRVPVERVLVVVDDADLPLGVVRMRGDGSAGGHHGLESVEAHLGTRAYARQRLGIGRRDPAKREITGHVLGRFDEMEMKIFGRVLRHAVSQVACWLDEGIEKAMARFNGSVSEKEEAP